MIIEKDGYKQGTEVEDLDKILQSEEDFQKQKEETQKGENTIELPDDILRGIEERKRKEEEIKSLPIEEIKERCLILISSWSGFMEDWEKNLKKKFTEIPLEGDVFRNGSPLETEPEPDFKDSFGGYYLFKRFLKNSLQIRDSLKSNSLPEDEIRSVYDELESLTGLLLFALTGNADGIVDEIEREKIREINRKHFKGDKSKKETHPIIREIQNIEKLSKSSQIQVSKDLWKLQFSELEDAVENLGKIRGDKEDKAKEISKAITTRQDEGKLLFGTKEELTGGNARFKIFTIALAQALNEQSRFYNTEEDWTGIPVEKIKEVVGTDIVIQKTGYKEINGENRPYPHLLLIYEDIANKMSSTGKISGGKDIKDVDHYINGGEEVFQDPVTGKKKKRFVRGVKDQEYLIPIKGGYLGIPFIFKEASIKLPNLKEIGMVCSLSPQFSKSVKKYTALRSDTIQLLGKGKQKDITLALIDLLLYYRGVPQKGNTSEFSTEKSPLLDKIAVGKDYQKRPGKKESDFQEAILKAIDAKILAPGRTKDGRLKGYREEKTAKGTIRSVFVWNKDYFKDTPLIEDQ